MTYKYLCERWQGLLEQIVNLCGNGYYYYHISYLPVRKKEKYEQIDKKIIDKYRLKDITKDKRYQRKKKGLANFYYLRWKHIMVVLHTEGNIIIPSHMEDKLMKKGKFKNEIYKTTKQSLGRFNQKQIEMYSICADDDFTDLRQTPIFLKISDQVEFDIQILEQIGNRKKTAKQLKKKDIKNVNKKPTVTVKMSKEMYNNRKTELLELVEKQAKNRLLHSFNLLNRIPAWRGVIKQKVELQHILIRHAKQHHMKLSFEDLFVNTRRKKEDNIFKEVERLGNNKNNKQ